MKKWINGFVCLLSIGFLTLPCLGQSKPAVEEDCPTCKQEFEKYLGVILKENGDGNWQVLKCTIRNYPEKQYGGSRGLVKTRNQKSDSIPMWRVTLTNAKQEIISKVYIREPGSEQHFESINKNGVMEGQTMHISGNRSVLIYIPYTDDVEEFTVTKVEGSQISKALPLFKKSITQMQMEAVINE